MSLAERLLAASVVSLVIACSTTAPKSSAGAAYVSLAYILAHPQEFPSGQEVNVAGYLATGGANPMLYLTSEHARARDTRSAIFVSDPSSDGSLIKSDCVERFVAITGTFRRRSIDLSIEEITTVEYWKPSAKRSSEWDEIIPVQCWASPTAETKEADSH